MEKNRTLRGKVGPVIFEYKAFFILLVLFVIAILSHDKFLSVVNLTNVVRQSCVSIIMGCGFTMLMASGGIDLSVGSMMGLIGVLSGMVSKVSGMPFVVTFLVTVLIGAVCGLLNGIFTTVFNVHPFIVTLAMASVFEGVNFLITGGHSITQLPKAFTTLGQSRWLGIPIIFYITFVVVVICAIMLYRTKFGRHCIAQGGNREAARVCGVKNKLITVKVHVLVGCTTAIGAMVMVGRAGAAMPAAGAGMEMDVIAAVIIGGTPLNGGKGNIVGTVIGCLIVAVINNALNLLNVNNNWQTVSKGLLILVAVIFDMLSSGYIIKKRAKR